MADIHRLPDEGQVLQEASDWMARLQADAVTVEDRERFEAWRTAHPLHRRTFDELAATWKRFTAVRPLVNAVAFGHSMNEAGAQVEAARAGERRRRHRLAWATAVVGISVALSVFALRYRNPGRLYLTTRGEHATVSLSDGSILELDGDSRARVQFSKRYRVVQLQRGEASFKVAHDEQRPFWVVGGGSWVRDVGTAFTVRLEATDMRVTVTQGTVKVGAMMPLLRELPFRGALLARETAIAVLTAGHQADLSGTVVRMQPLDPAQMARATSWRAATLYFENAPLADVAAELGRYTSLRLEIPGEHLRQLPVGGTFEASPQGVATFLAMLDQGLGLSVHRSPGEVVIGPAGDSTR